MGLRWSSSSHSSPPARAVENRNEELSAEDAAVASYWRQRMVTNLNLGFLNLQRESQSKDIRDPGQKTRDVHILGHQGISALASFLASDSTITSLNVADNFIGESMEYVNALVQAIAASPSLHSVSMRLNNLNDESAEGLVASLLCKVTSVDLSYNYIGPAGCASIAAAIASNRKFTSINLSQNRGVGPAGVSSIASALKSTNQLQSLLLSGCQVTDDGAAELGRGLAVGKSITTLDLSHNHISGSGLTRLVSSLRRCLALHTFDVKFNRIADDGANALADLLSACSSLSVLDLSFNELGAPGVMVFSRVLATTTSLSTLSLTSNRIGSEGARAIADAMAVNTSITTLNIRDTAFCENGDYSVLYDLVSRNATISTLNIARNRLSGSGARVLAEALKINSALRSIDLSLNRLHLAGCEVICIALKENNTITNLSLGENEFNDKCLVPLADMLSCNTTLATLSLHYNYLPSILEIIEALRENYALTTLLLGSLRIDEQNAEALAALLQDNSTLVEVRADISAVSEPLLERIGSLLVSNKDAADNDYILK